LARTLQRGMPQLRLAIEVLHPANEPPIQPFVPGFASTPLTGLALVCTRAQSRSRMFWSADERAANVSTFFSSLRSRNQSAGRSDRIGTALCLFVYASDLSEKRFLLFGPMRQVNLRSASARARVSGAVPTEDVMFARTAFCCLALAIVTSADADELTDKVCPILEKTASELADKAGFAVQAELVMSIGGAYDFDGEALRTVTDNIDAAAGQGCPDARDVILKRLDMQSLQQALR